MAKTPTATNLRPEVFGALQEVLASDCLEVVEAQAYALDEARPQLAVQFYTDTPGEEAPAFDGTTLRDGEFYVPSWATEVTAWVIVDPDGSVTSVDVDIDLGAASDAITVDASTSWAGEVAVTGMGSGWLLWELGGTATDGSATPMRLHFAVTAISLPDPA